MAVLLYRGKSWLSRLIQWRTWSPYSHAAWLTRGDARVCEAWWPDGVRIVPGLSRGHTPGTVIDVYQADFERDPAKADAVTAFYERHEGERYDLWGILGFAVRRRCDKPGWWFCSEILQAACASIGEPLVNAEPWRTSPGLLGTSTRMRYTGQMEVM